MVYDDQYYRTALYIRYFGQFSFRISDPIVFFSQVAGSVKDSFDRNSLMDMCKDEFMTALDTSLSQLAAEGVKFSQIPAKQREIAKFMADTLDEEWTQRRGIEVVAVAIAKVTPDEKSRQRIEQFDTNVMHSDPNAMVGGLAYAQMQAMQDAAKNSAGAMTGFMGLGMMNNMAGNAAPAQGNLIATATELQKQREVSSSAAAADGWTCSCGNKCVGKFCASCGSKRPEQVPADSWKCSCGAINKGNFCPECGGKRPVKAYFCTNCGNKSETPFKFCASCGTKYEG